MSAVRHDLLGRPLTPAETRLLAAYEALKALAAEDLPPNAAANVREALAALWQAVHGLMLTDERCDA
jgi:hypothetical protein